MRRRAPDVVRHFGLPAGVVVALLLVGSAYGAPGSMPLTTQDPASAQPTLPKPMPDLTVPTGGAQTRQAARKPRDHVVRGEKPRHRAGARTTSFDRPALAGVELTERLPNPPQPPHVSVPVPAYPLENLVTSFTAPPPPVVCRPTRRDPFQPDPHLFDERSVLCTADNP